MTQGIADKFSALHLTPQRQLHGAMDNSAVSWSRLGFLLAPFVGVLALAVLVSGETTPQTATAKVRVSGETGSTATPKDIKIDWPTPRQEPATDFDLEYQITLVPASEAADDAIQESSDYDAEVYLAEMRLIEGLGVEIELSDELMCLALNIYFEARSEPLAGKLAVGHVVMNRVSSRNFPQSICAVVRQGGERTRFRCQFSWWCDGKSDDPRNASAWDESLRLANLVYKGYSSDPTAGALWYHADYVKPKWRKAFNRGPQIGRHIFYSKRPTRKGTQVASNVTQ